MGFLVVFCTVLPNSCNSTEPALKSPTESLQQSAPAAGVPSESETADHQLPDPRTEWLARNAVPLATVEAGHGFEDLVSVGKMVGNAQVVGLGEGTHGTREYFQAKHRLLEFLVREKGFSIFAIEANMPEAHALDAYINGAPGDVNALIAGMYFWTWNTEEVRTMVEWMRAYNHEEKPRGATALHFTGFDMQTGRVALSIVREFMRKNDSAWLEAEGTTVLDQLENYDAKANDRETSFGCATAKLPVESFRGKKLRLRGWIKTDGLQDGWAGLWLRVDGPRPWFDNMQDRGLAGTSDWEERELELEVPSDARAIFFGLVMPGTGKAWFDDLSIEVDGSRWRSDELDLDFEGPEPRGLVPADPGGRPGSAHYSGRHDRSEARSGSQSFLLASLPRDKGGMDSEAATAAAHAVVAHMEGKRDQYASTAEVQATEWAIQNARIVEQWTGGGTDELAAMSHRDECMANNVLWILQQDPSAKIVLWAHNGHVTGETPFMGSHLRQRLGADYVNVAFCSSHGTYTALDESHRDLGAHTLSHPPPGSFEAILEMSGKPILFVDLRVAREDDPGSAWLTETRLFGGTIGAVAMPDHYEPTKLQADYDLLLWVRDTSASRPLANKRR
jgi:erythromycin esterase-like protein